MFMYKKKNQKTVNDSMIIDGNATKLTQICEIILLFCSVNPNEHTCKPSLTRSKAFFKVL